MTHYSLPLPERLRYARDKRWRYRTDPAYRLACVNRERAKRGLAPLADVSALPELRPMEPPVRRPHPAETRHAERGERGRFA